MATKLGKILADFTTSLATALAVGGTSATLQSATDDDGVALPAGQYYFALDGGTSNKEHIQCQLSGTSITSIYSVSRQGTLTSGVARKHRVGCSVALTDFAYISFMQDLMTGTTDLNASTPLKYDGVATISNSAHLATKKYVDDTAVAGAPDASVTVKGVAEEATQAEIDAATGAGGTSARLFVNPSTLATSIYGTRLPTANEKTILTALLTSTDWYAATSSGSDTYAITVSPAIGAYATGQRFRFKADVANTGACTLNVSGLGAKTIKKRVSADLDTGDILASQIVEVVYDGTNFQLISITSRSGGTSMQVFTASGTWTQPTGVTQVDVEVVGGGGSGGGTSSGAGNLAGGGGGAGGYARALVSVSGNVTVTVGTGGAGASNSTNAGNNSSFAGGTTITANGGSGGSANGTTNSLASGGGGGSTTNGTYAVTGQSGEDGLYSTNVAREAGAGGSNPLGFGAQTNRSTAAAGSSGTGYGAGGSGAIGADSTARAGGSGTDGVVIVRWNS